MRQIDVSVIVPIWGDWDRLDLCLRALADQSLPADRFEVIVANNEAEPRDPPAGMPGNGRIIHVPKPGSYAARNAALGIARGEVLAFTDADCIPSSRWLEEGLALVRGNGGARVTGPVSLFREQGGGYYAWLYECHLGFRVRDYVDRMGVTPTANLMASRAVFERVGNFDERMLSGGDFDWNERATAAGIPLIYDEVVEVRHPARKSLGAIWRKKLRVIGGVVMKDGPMPLSWCLKSLFPPVSFFRRHGKDMRFGDALALFLILWAMRPVVMAEAVLVAYKLKSPNRS